MANNKTGKKIGTGRHRSQLKRDRENEKLKARNRSNMSRMKSAIKSVRAEKSADALAKAMPIIMKTAKKGVIHARKASRLVSRLAKAVNAAKA